MARLGDVVTISPGSLKNDDEQIWLLNLDMVEQKTGNILAYNFVSRNELNGSIIQFDTGNVLYSKLRPNLNKVVLPIRAGYATSEMLPLRPNADIITREYLSIYLRSNSFVTWATSKTTGAKMPRLGTKDLLEKDIPIPSLTEQKQIVTITNGIYELILLYKQQLTKLDELVKARFVEMFGDIERNPYGWLQTTIGSCCTLKSGTSLPTEKENEGGTVPYIKVGDMNYPGNEHYITTSSRFVSEETAGAGIFPVGTVIFPKRGGAIGTNKKRLTSLPICADLNVMGVTAGSQLTPQYLMAYFNAIDLRTLDNGSSIPQINNKDIAPLVVSLPPLPLQNQFAVFVAQVEKLKAAVQSALDKAQLLFDSLMQKYFG